MPDMRFLFVSIDGLIGDIAWQVAKKAIPSSCRGNPRASAKIADGFVSETETWERE